MVENDLNLFKELPTHLRAQVAWRSNKPVLDKINTFQVGCACRRKKKKATPFGVNSTRSLVLYQAAQSLQKHCSAGNRSLLVLGPFKYVSQCYI